MKRVYLPLLLAAVCAGLYAADDTPDGYLLNVTGWSYARERKTVTSSNRVTATCTVANTSQKALDGVQVTVGYFSGLGEKAAGPFKAAVGSLKAGEKRQVTLVGDFVPIFSAYSLTVEYRPTGKEEWYSSSDTAQPQAKNSAPLPGVASVSILGKEGDVDIRTGRFNGVVRVKNEGTLEAKNVKITVTFYDANRKKTKEWSGPLGTGSLAGGKEANIPFSVPNAPRNLGGYEIRVGSDDAAELALAGGEFTTNEDVEFAHFEFKRTPPKGPAIHVKAAVRNGFSAPASDVKLTLSFLGPKVELAKYVYTHPEALKPGEVKAVEFTVANVPVFEGFEQAVSYEKGGASTGPKPEAKAAEHPKFRNVPDVEIIFTDAVVNDDKSVSLVGSMRNGKSVPVKDVIVHVTMKLANGETLEADKVLMDLTQPKETRDFVVKIASAAGFTEYSFKFKYGEVAGAAKANAPQPAHELAAPENNAEPAAAAAPAKESAPAKKAAEGKDDAANALKGAL